MTSNKNTLTIVLIVIIVLLLFGGLGGGMMNGYLGLSWIFNILMVILVVMGIYWLVKNINFNERRR